MSRYELVTGVLSLCLLISMGTYGSLAIYTKAGAKSVCLSLGYRGAEIDASLTTYCVKRVDQTGIGDAVYQLVKQFFPAVVGFTYSPHVKAQLVFKTHDVISKGRLEFDAGHADIAQSLMTIRRTTTASGGQVTYKADRSEEASHGDIAWATMHAMANEPIDGQAGTKRSILEIYS